MLTPEKRAKRIAQGIHLGRVIAPHEFEELLKKEGIVYEDIGESCPFIDFRVGDIPIEIKATIGKSTSWKLRRVATCLKNDPES